MYNQGYSVEEAVSKVVRKVYGWMAIALGITASVAYYVGTSPAVYRAVFRTPMLPLFLFFAQIMMVFGLVAGIRRMSYQAAILTFLGYAALTGLTFSTIFIAFTLGSIFSAFFVTAGMFGVMALYGYFTKADLSGMGSFLMMGLFGLIIAMLVNMFLASPGLHLVYSAFGVVIFSLFTAYDIQKIKMFARSMVTSGDDLNKIGVLSALTLYLDFINLFSFILNFLGERKR